MFAPDDDPERPFSLRSLADRRRRMGGSRTGRITLHECHHTFASLMIGARVSAKALSVSMGHARIAVTFDLYGHLMPSSETEAAEQLDGYPTPQRERAEHLGEDSGARLIVPPGAVRTLARRCPFTYESVLWGSEPGRRTWSTAQT